MLAAAAGDGGGTRGGGEGHGGTGGGGDGGGGVGGGRRRMRAFHVTKKLVCQSVKEIHEVFAAFA